MLEKLRGWVGVHHSDCLILIVDDSEADRLTYRRYLESSLDLGCNILDCELAENALQICQKSRPDLILLDYLLPDVDGIELLKEMAGKFTTLPSVIMLTGQGTEAVAVDAMKYGARDYLIKGQLTSQKLVNVVLSALTEQKLEAQLDRQRLQRELLTSMTLKISYAVELSQILQAAVEGTRELLGCDRTMIYRLEPDMSCTIVAEAVLPEWSTALGSRLDGNDFKSEQACQMARYLQGHKLVVADIEASQMTPGHLKMLQQLQVKAVLEVPILLRDINSSSELTVWGFLIAHHCQSGYEWQMDEMSLLDELSIQMAIAIQQSELVSDLKIILEKQQMVEHQLCDRVREIEQTNIRLSLATRLLERRNQELDEFSCIASHDLQAPLRGISNLTEWLSKDLEGKLPAENQHQLELIQSRVSQMNLLINGLLQYARVGKENIGAVPANLSELLAEVIESCNLPPDFRIQIPANLPIITTQILLLKQVFANLIANAVKHHDRNNGHIDISFQDLGSWLQFTVVDDGIGIAPEHHTKIFVIFQTLPGNEDVKGTGVGLAIIKKIVESQGGSVWVDSELGQGSAFSFTWPKIP